MRPGAFVPRGSAAAGAGGARAFRDRADAGRRLAEHLGAYADRAGVIVLGLPRGGVPVAVEVARALHAPLDVFVVRKLGVPGDEELAMGAIATGGVIVLNDGVVSDLRVSEETIANVAAAELAELERREQAYRGTRPPAEVEGRIVILVDDGLATGATMRAAVRAVRMRSPARVVVAVPVAAEETYTVVRSEADDVVCPLRPPGFRSVGGWYDDFSPTGDDEVRTLLNDIM
jgi:predicted phosphoribosyltransferase